MFLMEFSLHVYNSYKLESNIKYGLVEFSLHVYTSYKLESNIMYGFGGVQFT